MNCANRAIACVHYRIFLCILYLCLYAYSCIISAFVIYLVLFELLITLHYTVQPVFSSECECKEKMYKIVVFCSDKSNIMDSQVVLVMLKHCRACFIV